MSWLSMSNKGGEEKGGVPLVATPTIVGTAGVKMPAANSTGSGVAAVAPTVTISSWCMIAFCSDEDGGWCQGRLLAQPANSRTASGGGAAAPAGDSAGSGNGEGGGAAATVTATAMSDDEDDFASAASPAPPKQMGLYGEEVLLEAGHPDRAKFHRCCFADDDEVHFFSIKTIDYTKPDGSQETVLGVVAKSGGDTVKLESQNVEFITTRYTLGADAAAMAAQYFPSLGVQRDLLICEGEIQLETPKPPSSFCRPCTA